MKHNYPLYNDHPLYTDMETFIDGIAARYGEAIALSFRKNPRDKEPVRVSYRQLAADVHALANEAAARGMEGQHCALIGKLSYEWICSYIALQTIGAVVVPLDRDWTGEDLAATAKSAVCRYIFCDSDLSGKAEEVLAACGDASLVEMNSADGRGVAELMQAGAGREKPAIPAVDPRAMSVLVFTSGTTGKGKGVMLTQYGIVTHVYYGLQNIRAGARTIDALPPHHTYGSNIGFLAPLYAGSELYISGGLKYILQELKEVKPDYLILVPLFVETFYRRIQATVKESGKDKLLSRMMRVSQVLRKVGIDLRRKLFRQVLAAFGGELRFIVSGGAPLRPELVETFEALGIDVLNGYGITECSPLIGVNRNKFNRVGSVGVPIPSVKVRIDHPNEVGEGEICVSGDNVMLGYYQDEEATGAVIDSEGYFHTGDIGRMDADGCLYVTGRIKNLIILSNGKNVYPEEIETAVSAIPGVVDVVVYEGVSRRGSEYNQIVAEIYPDKDFLEKSGITDANAYFHRYIDDYNRTAVQYKKIGLLRVREEEFPKNTLRKITRFKLDMSID